MRRLLAVLCVLYLPLVHATNHGVVGKTYLILEQDFLEYIEQKIKHMQANGEWSQVQSEFKNQVKARLIRPTPTHLPKAVENRATFFNPSIVVPYDVHDASGQLIVKKGTVVNPLDRVGLSSTLIFFDGDDKAQVQWVLNELKKHTKVKLILTSGSIKETAHYFKQAIYFDLNGFLVGKFHIQALPVRVQQVGNRLQISEVNV